MKTGKLPSLNAAWHKKHLMPENPTQLQKAKWHIAHAKHCGCRPIPPKLMAEIKKVMRSKQ